MAKAARNDPYKNFNFLVEIDGIALAGFRMHRPSRGGRGDRVPRRQRGVGGQKASGPVKVGDITLKRGITGSKERHDWIDSVRHGVGSRGSNPAQGGTGLARFANFSISGARSFGTLASSNSRRTSPSSVTSAIS